MDFNFDTGAIYGGVQTIDVSTLPPLGGTAQTLTIIGTGALKVPVGTSAEQPGSPVAGMFRYNSTNAALEFHNGSIWTQLSIGGGSVTSVAASGSTGLTVGGSPITSSGTLTFTLAAQLQGLSSLTTTPGVLVQTASGVFNARTITGTASNIVVTNGDGVSGNPTINLATVTQGGTGSLVKVTLDTFGRVSGNTAVLTSDITALVNSTYVAKAGDTMSSTANLTFAGGGEVLGLPQTPSGDTAATSKFYVDSLTAGLSWKQSVRAATTANITGTYNNGTAGVGATIAVGGTTITIDGTALVNGDRLLVKNQSSNPNNGIYSVSGVGSSVVLTRSVNLDQAAEFDGAAVWVQSGTTQASTGWTQTQIVTTVGTSPVIWSQFSGSGTYTAGTGLALTGNVFSLTSPVDPSLGGTGTTTGPTTGQILIGTSGGTYQAASLTQGTGITITPTSGAITIANAGVLSITGTANQITASASTGAITLSLPTSVSTTNLTASGLTANSLIYSGTGGLLTSAGAATNGQILIGSTGVAPVRAAITQGTGISVTNGAGSITIANTGVTSVAAAGGSTGLTFTGSPITTTGTLTLGGTLAAGSGGTGLNTSAATNGQLLIGNGSGLSLAALTAGTGISVTNGAGSITVNNTGVTSVALALPSFITVSGSPVTTTGTLTGTLATQSQNTVFVAPVGSTGAPTFRTLAYADLPIALYKENPSTPTTPVVSGTNSTAIGSGSSATATNSYANGAGTNARILGQKAFANGAFATAGDAQHGIYVARNITTNATITELFLDGSATQLVLPDNSLFTFDIIVSGRRTDATGGGAGYRFVGIAKKDTTAGSVTFVGTPSKTIIGETNAAWDAVVNVVIGTGAFRVQVTGEAAKTIRWVATISTTEVTN